MKEISTRVKIKLAAIRGGVFEDLNGNGLRDTQLIQGDNPALIVAIDTSGSTEGFAEKVKKKEGGEQFNVRCEKS